MFNYFESMGNLEKEIAYQKEKQGGDGLPNFESALSYY
jgi:hypothetical protein